MISLQNRRYLGPLLLVLGCIATFFTTVIAFRSIESIQKGYRGKLLSIAASYSNAIRDEIATRSMPRIKGSATSVLQDEDMLQVIIFDASGAEIYRVTDERKLKDLDLSDRFPPIAPTLQPPGMASAENERVSSQAQTLFDSSGRAKGGVILHMSRAPEQELVRRALTSTVFLGGVVFVLSMIPVVLLVRRINRNTANLERLNAELDAASRIKERFLANMSHEIRTPMNSIIGFTELLEDSELQAEQQEWVSVIQHNGKQLIHLINQILSFSKIENDKMQISSKEVLIRKLLNQVYVSFEHLADKKQLDLHLDVDASVPTQLKLDPDAVVQCLNNLLSNALKFTDSGQIILGASFDAEAESAGRGVLCLSVSDTGRGIPKSRQADIFNAFSQVEGDDTYRFNGTGLGLSITQSLMELMGGTISLESPPGQGSCFMLRIPCQVEPSPQIELTLPSVEPLPSQRFTDAQLVVLSRLRVIVAEDNAFNQKLILRMLRKCGVSADWVPNGKALLQALAHASYDLILMDINMPDLDGWEATRKIRQMEAHAKSRIVAVSASRNDDFVDRCYQSGMDDFMGKPFRQADLHRILSASISAPD